MDTKTAGPARLSASQSLGGISAKRTQCMKEESLTLRLDKQLREALEELAAKDRRTLSDYVRLTLLAHVQNLYQASGKVFREHTPIRRKEGK